MFANITRQLLSRRAPATSCKRLLARQYVGPIANHEAIDALTSKLTVEEQVQNIVNPSTYDQIERTKQIAQSARLQNMDLGVQLSEETRFSREEVSEKLSKLYNDLKSTRVLTTEDRSAVLAGFSELRDGNNCARVIREMRTLGHTVTAAQFATALRAAAASKMGSAVYAIGEEMQAAGIADAEGNYAVYFEQLVQCLSHQGQAEHAYSVFLEMRSRGFIPSRNTCDALAGALGSIGEPGIALEIILEARDRGISLSSASMVKVLHSAALQLSPEPFKHCWKQLTGVMSFDVPEGDCDAGMNIAARTGDVDLAQDIVEVMKRRGFPITESQFEALFETLVRDSRWTVALNVLNIMREHSYGKESMTLRSMKHIISSHGSKKALEIVDTIFDNMLKDQKNMPYAVDSVTLDALVSAVAMTGIAAQAAERLRKWYPKLKIKRTPSSYAVVLDGCILSKDKVLAESLMADLLDVDKLRPTQQIYEKMILVSTSQFNYEDAFLYLQAMKAQGMVPSWKIYSTLVRRCAKVRDPRARVALKEMAEMGHTVTEALHRYVETGGRAARYSLQQKYQEDNSEEPEPPKKEKGAARSTGFDINFTL
ncbi:hypothetical protein LPJ75_003980 [Coemansia sp. RSA 2598]|nr:hypothetical protein LPJ75_003980 [Coemansia sp. RSA 2598]